MDKNEVLKRIQHGLIVSCQALENEPLHSSFIMSRMALAAFQGGAVGIRANTPSDIIEIKKTVNLPVIGLYKVNYNDSEVYITPTMQEIDALVQAGPEIIAMDATKRMRPGHRTLSEFFKEVRQKYPDQLFMADTSCYEEGVQAQELGFDLVGTTLCSYTEYTKGTKIPDYTLMKQYVDTLSIPIIAEGGIWTPEQLKSALDTGVWAAVVGTAITRPQSITERFVNYIQCG
ncbi:N-acetylmannosamine-6-phosphate 2-epimerase [Caproiciproducens sp. LBM24188]|nr:N-acetylmannosamine-6-phosphate 2-epimerase [Clostridiales bacterium]